MQNHSIIFYGPLGGKKKKRIGGGESGNKRTIGVLRKLAYNIITCEKPYPINSSIRIVIYPFQLLLRYIHLFYLAIRTNGPKSIHVSGFYNFLVYIEWLIVSTSRLFGIRVVYEARAGGMIDSYNENGKFYRFVFRGILKNASAILCQGSSYVPFIMKFTKRSVYYYPNYVSDEFFKVYEENDRALAEKAELVYFGRIAPSKNIEFIISVAKELKEKSFPFFLEIIGAGKDEYIRELKSLIKTMDLINYISFSNSTSPSDLFSKLEHKHIFIFPTQERREGHSNALTEAMSFGVVPVVSPTGFNRTVVGNQYLVVDDFVPEGYSDRILEIMTNRKTWIEYSKSVHKRVEECFTEKVVAEVLIKSHSGISK